MSLDTSPSSLDTEAMFKSGKKIGLALGSGGARGWAHIGVINALREMKVPIHCVAGTSMGAVVGAVFAAGKIEELHHLALHVDWKHAIYHFLDFSFSHAGLIDGSRAADFVAKNVQKTRIEELSVPFACVATDVLTGAEVVFREGNIVVAVRASMAIAGVFTPVRLGEAVLVDGGLVNPLPVNIARELGADVVIAVDVSSDPVVPAKPEAKRADKIARLKKLAPAKALPVFERFLENLEKHLQESKFSSLPAVKRLRTLDEMPGVLDISANVLRIYSKQITNMRLKLEPADVLIQPRLGRLTMLEFHKSVEAIEAGHAEAIKILDARALRRLGCPAR